MKILVLSDIHANRFALDKVLEDANEHYPGYEAVWFLGDLIGYGANPVETYKEVKQECNHNGQYHVWLSGNHEETLEIKEDEENISKSEQVDRRHLSELFTSFDEAENHFTNILMGENKIKELRIDEWAFFLTHISFADPHNDEKYLYAWFEHEYYVNLFKEEYRALSDHGLHNKCMLYGHTHVQTLVKAQQRMDDGSISLEAQKIIPFVAYSLERDYTWFINPGSVGIPNDLDTRASYAIIDLRSDGDDTITFCRVYYEIKDSLAAMKEKGYDYIHFVQKYRERLINASAHPSTPPSWIDHYEMAKQVQRK